LRTLMLLRHAKSAWGDAELADHERPLAPRGERAAELVGVFLAQRGLVPDLVLCSTAMRTRQTLGRVLAQLGRAGAAEKGASHAAAAALAPEVRHERGLYLADAGALLERLRELPDERRRVLLVGHNPGLEDLARALASEESAEALRAGLPTAALVELELPVGSWRALEPGAARLARMRRPKDLV
jgi:phosphohistidine phosphatase